MIHRLGLTVVVAASLAAASVPLRAASPDEQTRAVRSGEAVVTFYVRNDFGREVAVQLVTADGRQLDLGPVAAGSGHIFHVTESVLAGSGTVRMRLRSAPETRVDLSQPLLSDDTVLSRAFAVGPGAYVEMHVASELGNSRAWISNG